jgi:hypothetical protein
MAYFSNGSEGEILEDQCQECILGLGGCPTYGVQFNFNYDQMSNEKLKEAMNMLVNEKGICQTKEAIDEQNKRKVTKQGGYCNCGSSKYSNFHKEYDHKGWKPE